MGVSGKLWFMGNGNLKNDEKSVILATTHMVLYPAPAGIHVARSNFGWVISRFVCQGQRLNFG